MDLKSLLEPAMREIPGLQNDPSILSLLRREDAPKTSTQAAAKEAVKILLEHSKQLQEKAQKYKSLAVSLAIAVGFDSKCSKCGAIGAMSERDDGHEHVWTCLECGYSENSGVEGPKDT